MALELFVSLKVEALKGGNKLNRIMTAYIKDARERENNLPRRVLSFCNPPHLLHSSICQLLTCSHLLQHQCCGLG